jgi:hypothetical protein
MPAAHRTVEKKTMSQILLAEGRHLGRRLLRRFEVVGVLNPSLTLQALRARARTNGPSAFTCGHLPQALQVV